MRIKCKVVRSHVHASKPLEKDLLSLEKRRRNSQGGWEPFKGVAHSWGGLGAPASSRLPEQGWTQNPEPHLLANFDLRCGQLEALVGDWAGAELHGESQKLLPCLYELEAGCAAQIWSLVIPSSG